MRDTDNENQPSFSAQSALTLFAPRLPESRIRSYSLRIAITRISLLLLLSF
ncbi:hypothetical protein EDB13_105139 [Vibrio crassostreae]|nr:hypothetical protein EDB13_105139 [Vibrio crassostreae]